MVRQSSLTLRRIYDTLLNAYGPQGWWPAETPTEVAIGAILTQNTSWKNVEKAVAALRNAGLLDFRRLNVISESKLAEIVRPAGTYRVKARRLKNLARWVCRRSGGCLEDALNGRLPDVRRDILTVHGIGPETADAILLYAGNHPTFVVDAYTRRILRRHRLNPSTAGYAEVQSRFERELPPEAELFNEFHALLVELGKQHCHTQAHCDACPLAKWPHEADAL
jgi:endonuclease-3 related protein